MATPSRAFMASRRLFCTEAPAIVSLKPEQEKNALYRKLSALGRTPNESAAKVMNNWLREGRFVKPDEIMRYIKQLRKYKRFKHALELSEWMEKRGINMNGGHYAIRIDLLSKTYGLPSGEKYFMSLPEYAKNRLTYGALLNCYCKEKLTERAIALFEEMKELGFASTSLAYNNLMTLYMRLDQPEKVPLLIQEMKEKDIMPDTFSYNVWMNSCAAVKDIVGVERILEEIKRGEDRVKSDWTTYSNLAAIYVEAGLNDKADLALKELENKNKLRNRIVFHYLISLYAGTANLSEVYRVWGSLESAFPETTNLSYHIMLQALLRLDDIPGAEKLFKKWESCCSSYDIRLANDLIGAYIRKDMIKEAESLRETIIKKGVKLSFRTLEMFMDCYLKNQKMDLALRDMEAAISKVQRKEWEPKRAAVQALLKYFEDRKDVNGAEKFLKGLKKVNCYDREAFDALLRTYIAAGKTEPLMRERMKEGKIPIDSEAERLLEIVCGDFEELD